ncbi:transposable element tc3 transposase [Caerostris extrusa]|uniref:Transposable element tc3 transposase n=1 Tax=Caerostris extrusa TaxID=172846 RepID=A0AAV4UM83_CAEEX|nr:transposable element tc3 transposase [Caerostris extrusa]
MNNSKTNQDTKIRFAPNGWKRNRVLCGNKKIVLLATNRWRCRISDVGLCKATSDIKKKQLQQNSESAIAALRAYRYMKGMRDSKGPITSSALKKMLKKFEATGSLASRQSGRPSTAAAVATTVVQTVQSMAAVAAHGECNAREVSRQTGVSYRSVWKALRITLKRYPHKLQHKQELKPPDFDSSRGFANLVFNKMEEQHDWLHTVLWTDEAHFTLSGAANTHNCRVWTTENPHAFVEVPLQQPKK